MFWEHIDELTGVVLVVGSLILLGTGIDGEVKSILTIAAGWIFGRRYGDLRAKRK